MPDAVLCLDSGVFIKYLVAEQPVALSADARRLVVRGLSGDRLVAPAFAWAEVGSVLRKKARQRLLTSEQAATLWAEFNRLPIAFTESPLLRARAWQIAEAFGIPTLYDAAFLACVESALAPVGARREFWTTDRALVRQLGPDAPAYVHLLGG